MQEAMPALPAGWSLVEEERPIASCALSASSRIWLTDRRLIYAQDQKRGEGAARVLMLQGVMDVAHSHFERRWQTIGGWIIVALAFLRYIRPAFLWYGPPIANVIKYSGIQLVVIAAAVVVILRTARRFCVGFKTAGLRHPWVLHYDRRNTRQVGEFVAAVCNAVASR